MNLQKTCAIDLLRWPIEPLGSRDARHYKLLSHYTKELGGDLSDTPFLRVLRSDACSGTVALMDSDATPFSRMDSLVLFSDLLSSFLSSLAILPPICPLSCLHNLNFSALSLSHLMHLLSDVILFGHAGNGDSQSQKQKRAQTQTFGLNIPSLSPEYSADIHEIFRITLKGRVAKGRRFVPNSFS